MGWKFWLIYFLLAKIKLKAIVVIQWYNFYSLRVHKDLIYLSWLLMYAVNEYWTFLRYLWSLTHLPWNSWYQSHKTFLKALPGNHRFAWNDTGNPLLYTCNHSRLTENGILNVAPGIKDLLVYYRLLKFLYLPSAFPSLVLKNWYFFKDFVVVVALCLAQYISGRQNYPMIGKI